MSPLKECDVRKQYRKWDKEKLEEVIETAEGHYWAGVDSGIPDRLFDDIVLRLKEVDPESKLLEEVGLRKGDWGKPVTREVPMLSLEKCRTGDELKKWADKFPKENFTITPKVDGVALCLEYDPDGHFIRASTRGDGTTGEDVSTPVRRLDDIPMKIPAQHVFTEIRGELFFHTCEFPDYAHKFTSPRNAVAGYLKNRDLEVLPLGFFVYDVQPPLERRHSDFITRMGPRFSTPAPLVTPHPHSLVESIILRLEDVKNEWPFETDGLVIRVNDNVVYKGMGATAHHPRGAIAFKFADPPAKTTLIKVEWETSRTGLITPVAHFKPVTVSGATLSRATLHSLGIFKSLSLRIGCTLEIKRRGGVIPQVEGVLKHGKGRTVHAPEVCPACGNEAKETSEGDGLFLQCSQKTCGSQEMNSLVHYAKTVGMRGFGPKVVKILYEEDILLSISDFYDNHKEWVVVGKGVAKNLVKEVEAHSSIPLATFLAALGIDAMGTQTAKVVAEDMKTLEQVMNSGSNKFVDLEGIGDKTALLIVEGLGELEGEIGAIVHEVKILPFRKKPKGRKGPRGKLRGQVACLTGKFPCTKSKIEDLIRSHGGSVSDKVDSDTTMVVAAEAARKSSKYTKALKLQKENQEFALVSLIELVESLGLKLPEFLGEKK